MSTAIARAGHVVMTARAVITATAVRTAALAGLVFGLAGGSGMAPAWAQGTADSGASVADYYRELERAGLIDVDTGNKEALTRELGAAEAMLRAGAAIDAAVALYAIVESPRFAPFTDDVEYKNAEYYLAVSLATAGAYDSALGYLARVMRRGPSSLYFAPAHRRAVDIALETRDYQAVLTMLKGVDIGEPLPVEAAGERTYLGARISYQKGDLKAAEADLAALSPRSRLYSSALYLRGVIRARTGEMRGAAEAFCEIVDTPDSDTFTFVIDDRYFTIKDLARLGLGRIAHEQSEYDDAYYHYFQIPEDSDRLAEALFEAAWSMYQKRELGTARELVSDLTDAHSSSPLMPEARLLAGYIELADCSFAAAQRHYDELVAELQPVIDELERIRTSPERRTVLFARAIARQKAERAAPDQRALAPAGTPAGTILGMLRLDPAFVRLHEAVQGMQRAAGDAPHLVRQWTALGRRAAATRVGAVAADRSVEEEDAADANALLEDVRRLGDDIARARAEIARGERDKTLPGDVARAERARLAELEREVASLTARAGAAADAQAEAVDRYGTAGASLGPMLTDDLTRARALDRASRALLSSMSSEANQLAQSAIERLYRDTRRVLDKAKLGKIDAVIGQKRKLDIEVQDLAAGRWPAELHGRLWEQGLIGDDEEFWPFEGEFWADEYEGWR